MSVCKKLHQLQASTRSLAANAEGQTGAARYNYVSGAKLLGILRPQMDALGLILTQEVIGIENQPITYMTRNGEKTEMFTTVHIRFTWIDAEDGSTIVNEFFANGMNAWDKGLGSAITYAERYYLMKTFHIATDEDDIDAIVKDEAVKAHSAPAEAPAPAPAPMPKKPIEKPAQTAKKPAQASDYLQGGKYYQKTVEYAAQGKTAKSGEDYRTAWIRLAKPTDEQLEAFDRDVTTYRLNNNIQPAF